MTDQLAGTARWTAAARAVESRRPDRLFDDPWAERLAGPDGFATLERHDRSDNPYVALRTWWLDNWCTRTAVGGCRQIVLLAAGLDTRAFRLVWPAGTVVFEVDRPELLSNKDRVLADAGAVPGCDRHPVGGDLLGDWSAALRSAGFDPTARTGWIAEGLLVYLAEPAARRLLRQTAELSRPARLAGDVVGMSLLTSPWMRSYLQGLAEAGVSWQYGTDEPELLLTETGWQPEQVVQPAEAAPASRPWPYPAPPRTADGFPRSYLFSATRPPLGT